MLDPVKLTPNEIAAALVAISFAAGLNVYATLATLGLLAHLGLLPLPAALHLLTNWWVIGASTALFLVECFAHLCAGAGRGLAGLWCDLPAFSRKAVAGDAVGRSDRAGCPRGENGRPGGSHAFARAPLEHRFESGGRRTGDFSDLVCHPAPIRGGGHRNLAPRDHHCPGSPGGARLARPVPGCGGRTGSPGPLELR